MYLHVCLLLLGVLPLLVCFLQGRKQSFIGLHSPSIWHTYLPRKDLKVEKRREGGKDGMKRECPTQRILNGLVKIKIEEL